MHLCTRERRKNLTKYRTAMHLWRNNAIDLDCIDGKWCLHIWGTAALGTKPGCAAPDGSNQESNMNLASTVSMSPFEPLSKHLNRINITKGYSNSNEMPNVFRLGDNCLDGAVHGYLQSNTSCG
jgi:hypothetical protein